MADTYFQFPLCALSVGSDVEARLNAVIDYSVVQAGSKLYRKLTANQQRDFLAERKSLGKIPEGFDRQNWLDCAALYGAKVLGVIYSAFRSVLERHRTVSAYIAEFESRHGRDPLVRIKTSWLFAARDGRGITAREIPVICAIYSAIGDKEMAIITQPRIRRCALGYRTVEIMHAELPNRADKAQPLTERQLRDTITRLHRNKFFARCTIFRRITYYSIRLNEEELRKKVLESRTYPAFFRASQSAQDTALNAAIRRKRVAAVKQVSKPTAHTAEIKFAPSTVR